MSSSPQIFCVKISWRNHNVKIIILTHYFYVLSKLKRLLANLIFFTVKCIISTVKLFYLFHKSVLHCDLWSFKTKQKNWFKPIFDQINFVIRCNYKRYYNSIHDIFTEYSDLYFVYTLQFSSCYLKVNDQFYSHKDWKFKTRFLISSILNLSNVYSLHHAST